MFFADYRSKDRGQSVTPACTHACLRRGGTTPWATRAAPRRPRPGPRGRERTVWRRVARARSSPGLCYQRSRPPHGYSRPPLYLITIPHHSASTDQHLYIPLTGPLHPLNWHLGPLAAPPPTTATCHDHLPLPRVPCARLALWPHSRCLEYEQSIRLSSAPTMRRTPTSLPQLLAAATSWDSPTPHALLRKRLGRPWPSSLRCTHPSPPTCSFVPRVSVQFPLRAPVSACPCTVPLRAHATSPRSAPLRARAPPCSGHLPRPPTYLWACPCSAPVRARACPLSTPLLSVLWPPDRARGPPPCSSAMLRACPCSAGPSCRPTCGPVRCLPPVPARAAPG